MIPVNIYRDDSFEDVKEKLQYLLQDLTQKFEQINLDVYDFGTRSTKQDYTVTAFDSDQATTDMATHESDYNHALLHTRLHDINGASDHNSPSITENNLVDGDAAGYPIGDSGIAVGNVVQSSANMTDNTLLKGDGGAKNIQDTGITCDDSNNLGSIGTIATGAATITGASTIGDGGSTNYMSIAADGEIGLVGTARVIRDIWVPFSAMLAPTTKPATYVDHGISGIWQFADADDDTVVFDVKFPNDMDKTLSVTVTVAWSTSTTDPAETATWQLEYLYRQANEDTTAAAQGTISVDSGASTTANGLVLATLPSMDTPNASDVVMLCRLKRLGAGGNDDLTNTAELHGVYVQYASNKFGTAT